MTRLVTASTEWHDARLEWAYKLVDDVLDKSAMGQDAKALLRKACEAIEDADLAMENGE